MAEFERPCWAFLADPDFGFGYFVLDYIHFIYVYNWKEIYGKDMELGGIWIIGYLRK